MFKIRDKQTGLFSTGGTYPDFTKDGKVWGQIGHIKSHLKLLQEDWVGDIWVDGNGLPISARQRRNLSRKIQYGTNEDINYDTVKITSYYAAHCEIVEYEEIEKNAEPCILYLFESHL